ncbi:MAG: pyridoxamine 5'-phosphate oxidase family protein [Candidatus Electrothrix sp. AR3]|nr:pyridoxamine 5'-phosphate oxidase family protein [Candidatus Electrothrix sp. AR3]
MTLNQYFKDLTGKGILASANATGKVDAAIYAKPHIMADGQLAFIMRDNLTHHNLQSNPFATYMFIEDGPHYQGIRLFLKKILEDTNPDLINQMTRRHLCPETDKAKGSKFLVYFIVEKALPLIGSEETGIQLPI